MRMNTVDSIKMPPLAHEVRDQQSAVLLRDWITSMPGRPSWLRPPSPSRRRICKAVEVTLTAAEPGASIHYTLDGSTPTKSDAIYDKPIKISGPTTLRVKAYKTGFTKSITAQETFIVGE